MNQKPRPLDGPGANGLRGGKNIYSSKVCIGGFIEDVGGPAMYSKGFTNADFDTENTRYGQTHSSLKYGAGLPVKVSVEKPSTFDVFAPAKELTSSTWQTTTNGTYRAPSKTNNQSPAFTQSGTLRDTWTLENDAARKFRFQVESRMKSSNTAVAKFEIPDIRLLPGTPMAVESFRRKLIDRHGILSFSALRCALPKGTITLPEFRKVVASLGLTVSKSEFDQIVSYFTPSESFETEHFLRCLLTNMASYNIEHAIKLSQHAGDVREFIAKCVATDAHPEVAEGLSLYIGAYVVDGTEEIDASGIKSLCYDMYASAPFDYVGSLSSLWRI